MSFVVTLQPSGTTFEVEPGASILGTALDRQINLPFGCRAGFCTSCRGKVIEGAVDHGRSHLPQSQRDQGFALLCQASALSDLTIEAEVMPSVTMATDLPARVTSVEMLAPDVARVKLRVPPGLDFRYLAGQFIDVLFDDGERRSYSMASMPRPEGVNDVELHIRHLPGGLFTDRLFGGDVKVRALLKCHGPLGAFFLRESDKPAIMLASGTGYAPIRSILLEALPKDSKRAFTLYWGARIKRDLYLHEEVEALAREYPNFRYIPVLSEAAEEDAWTGRTGFVHRAVMEDHPDLSTFQVYACGTPVMVDAARADFTTNTGLPLGEFFSDSFVTAAEASELV